MLHMPHAGDSLPPLLLGERKNTPNLGLFNTITAAQGPVASYLHHGQVS
jgi:hypothetical protein